MKPNLFIVGAPKCGTSALAHYLSLHPEVFFCDPKEPFFLSDDYPKLREQHDLQTLTDYLDLFVAAQPTTHKIIAEGSTNYLASRTAIKNAISLSPGAKFIVMLRDPVQVAHAYHMEQLWARNETESDFEVAWQLQKPRQRGLHIPDSCIAEQFLQYAELTNFPDQIKRLFQLVEREKVLIIMQEELKRDAKKVYEQVLAFLSLDSDERSEFPL